MDSSSPVVVILVEEAGEGREASVHQQLQVAQLARSEHDLREGGCRLLEGLDGSSILGDEVDERAHVGRVVCGSDAEGHIDLSVSVFSKVAREFVWIDTNHLLGLGLKR